MYVVHCRSFRFTFRNQNDLLTLIQLSPAVERADHLGLRTPLLGHQPGRVEPCGKHLQPLGTSACPWENADVLLQNRFFEVELLTNKFIDEDTTKNENMVAPRRVL